MTLPPGYIIRPATAEDAAILATQRGQMFVDMGSMTPEAATQEHPVWAEWLRGAISGGEYAGFLVQADADVVGGVGIMFFPTIPTQKDPNLLKAHILNMYVEPTHRRKGLAEALMRAALAEVKARGIRSVSLNAAPMGQNIYKRLGFVQAANPEMRLTLKDSP